LGISLRVDPNVVLWTGISPELAELLSNLISSRRIYIHPAALDSYKERGKGVKLPVVTELAEDRLSRPCWFPAALKLVPPPGGTAGRFGRVARIKLNR
jgi:hypothetical protein